jgi:hypothetical protein
LKVLPGKTGGQGTDHVVRLVAGHGHHRDAKRRQEGFDVINRAVEVGLQLFIELLPGRLVCRIPSGAKRVSGVVDPGHVLRMPGGPEPKQKIHHPPGRRGVLAATGAQRAADHGKKRPIDQGIAVHQKEAGRGGRHRDQLIPTR